jgi:hypothetical protein
MDDIRKGKWESADVREVKQWNSKTHYWFAAASQRRWIVCNSLFVPICLGLKVHSAYYNQVHNHDSYGNGALLRRQSNSRNLQYQTTIRTRYRSRKSKIFREYKRNESHCHGPSCQSSASYSIVSLFDVQWDVLLCSGWERMVSFTSEGSRVGLLLTWDVLGVYLRSAEEHCVSHLQLGNKDLRTGFSYHTTTQL